jgi:hypothetical protein
MTVNDRWSIWIRAGAPPPVLTAAEDLREYLATASNTRMSLDPKQSLSGWERAGKAIVAGTRDQLAARGDELRG